jgi:hypothetical protein
MDFKFGKFSQFYPIGMKAHAATATRRVFARQ